MEVVNTVFPKYLPTMTPILLPISSPSGPAPSNPLVVHATYSYFSLGPPAAPSSSCSCLKSISLVCNTQLNVLAGYACYEATTVS